MLVVEQWPKSGGKTKAKTKTESVSDAAGMLAKKILGLHRLAAEFAGPEANITPDQAHELAKALEEFCNEYGFVVSGKTAALTGLLLTVAWVEGPVIYKIWHKLQDKKKPVAGGGEFGFKIPD